MLAISGKQTDAIVEVVKNSFAIILGFFFGSQVSKKEK